ncbi:lipoate--protein ligase family protein [Gemella bergeri]
MLKLLTNKKFNIFKTINIVNPLIPIATDEMFLRTKLYDNECILHIYTLPNSAIIGTPDTRIPFFYESLFTFYRNDMIPAVRNVGGLGIIADTGILNLSIIMTKPKENFSINEGYFLMTDFVKAIFPEGSKSIKAYEIKNSYCPGDFDLSINGKKFAGIAQRKIKNSVVISIYISLFGNQNRRADIMKEFYVIGIANQQINYNYPIIKPECMDTLENLLGISLTVEDILKRINKVLASLNIVIKEGIYTAEMLKNYEQIFIKLKERNEYFLKQK